MGKQKYPTTAGGVTVDGERRQRDYTKTGKLAQRRETRRLEAIERQVVNIQSLEQALEKAKDKEVAQRAITNAQLTLQQIRGGVPHKELVKRFTTKETNEKNESIESAPKPSTKNSK
jgi:LPS O-antigen subunit length determinant protein (WzzB/FepE family)